MELQTVHLETVMPVAAIDPAEGIAFSFVVVAAAAVVVAAVAVVVAVAAAFVTAAHAVVIWQDVIEAVAVPEPVAV